MKSYGKTGLWGRITRVFFGAVLLGFAGVFLMQSAFTLFVPALGVAAGLLIFYLLVHFMVIRFAPKLNMWAGVIVANAPAALVFMLGQPGGLIFGNGEGFLGAALYIGVSLFVIAWRAEAGCEVMTIPSLIFGKQVDLACALFTPIDEVESKLANK